MSESEKDTDIPAEPHVVGGLFDNQIATTIAAFTARLDAIQAKLAAIAAKLGV